MFWPPGALALGSLTLGQTSCHAVRTLRGPERLAHWGTEPPANSKEESRSPVSSHVSEPCGEQILRSQTGLHMPVALAGVSTAASWETSKQNHPAPEFLTQRNTRIYAGLLFEPLSFGVIFYAAGNGYYRKYSYYHSLKVGSIPEYLGKPGTSGINRDSYTWRLNKAKEWNLRYSPKPFNDTL